MCEKPFAYAFSDSVVCAATVSTDTRAKSRPLVRASGYFIGLFVRTDKHVDCPTRKHRILGLCLTNARNTCVYSTPPGGSGHNIVNFIPKNRPVVLRVPSTTRTVSDWSSAALDVLKGLLECTGEPVWPSGKAVGW